MGRSWLFRWERWKLAISEILWAFHPRRNRFCKDCGELIGNSRLEAQKHNCDYPNTW